jgi:uncharacterized protein (TIGR03435 family)
LLTLALRKNRARIRHALWLAASVKFLIPVSILIALGGHLAWRPAPAARQFDVSLVLNQVTQPFTVPVPSTPMSITAQPAANPLPAILFTLWICGFAAITFSWWLRWRRIRAAVRLGAKVQLAIPIRAISSPVPIEPGIFGIFQPILLLPDGIFDRLTPAQLRAVVAHELCHVRHRDNLVAAVHMFVETVFWFYPPVWWIGKRMVAERERACDEEVILLGNHPRVYAEGILNVCKLYAESPLACVSGVSGSDLRKRIQGIVSGRIVGELSLARKAMLLVAGIACLALPVLIGIWNAPPRPSRREVSIPLSPPSGAKFLSVAIERCGTYHTGEIRSPAPGRLVGNCVPLISLIYTAWLKSAVDGTQLIPLSGEPVWVDSFNYLYRIDAQADPGTSLATLEGPMLQSLLADRFGLKVRRVTRESPMYALKVAKGGAKLLPSNQQSCRGGVSIRGRTPLLTSIAARTVPLLPGQINNCGPYPVWSSLQYETLAGEAMSMADLCRLLENPLARPVIDKTGIGGKFDFHLKFASSDALGPLRRLYPSLSNLVEEQLGLKLEPITGPRDFLVIDQVKMPLPE